MEISLQWYDSNYVRRFLSIFYKSVMVSVILFVILLIIFSCVWVWESRKTSDLNRSQLTSFCFLDCSRISASGSKTEFLKQKWSYSLITMSVCDKLCWRKNFRQLMPTVTSCRNSPINFYDKTFFYDCLFTLVRIIIVVNDSDSSFFLQHRFLSHRCKNSVFSLGKRFYKIPYKIYICIKFL